MKHDYIDLLGEENNMTNDTTQPKPKEIKFISPEEFERLRVLLNKIFKEESI